MITKKSKLHDDEDSVDDYDDENDFKDDATIVIMVIIYYQHQWFMSVNSDNDST